MQRGTVRHPFLVYILNMFTCGLYGLYWFFVTCEDINRGLGRREFNPILDFVLIWLTCGLWWFWWSWRASESIVEVQEAWGVRPKMDEALMFIIAIFGFGMIVKQLSLNNAWEKGSPMMGHIGHEPPRPASPHHQQQAPHSTHQTGQGQNNYW